MSKRYLSKADILNAGRIKFYDLEVPEFGEDAVVRLKGWTIAEADDIARVINDGVMNGYIDDWTQQIVAVSVVDEAGELMFASPEDYVELGKLSPAGLARIKDEALRINLPALHKAQSEKGEGGEADQGSEDATAKN